MCLTQRTLMQTSSSTRFTQMVSFQLPISSTVLSGWHVEALSRHVQLLQLRILLPLQRHPWGTWTGLLLC